VRSGAEGAFAPSPSRDAGARGGDPHVHSTPESVIQSGFRPSARGSCFSGWHIVHDKTGLARPFRCGGWRCERCGPRRRNETARSIRRWASDRGLRFFWTFTLPGEGDAVRGDPHLSREVVPRMWNRLKAYVEWKTGRRLSFIAVPEPQRDGTCHLHVVTNLYLTHDLMSEAWSRAGGGFVWVERTDVRKTGAYLAKYLAKGGDERAPWDERVTDPATGKSRWRGWRRVWTSRDIRLNERPLPSGEWSLVRASPDEWNEVLEWMRDEDPEWFAGLDVGCRERPT